MCMIRSHDIVEFREERRGEERRDRGDRDSFLDHVQVPRRRIAAIII